MLGTLLLVAPAASFAQENPGTAPASLQVLLQNSSVRVIEAKLKPGQKTISRPHPEHLTYFLADARLKLIRPDGTTATHTVPAGQAVFSKGDTHLTENVGDQELDVLEVELLPGSAQAQAPLPPGDDAAKTGGNASRVILENERVRVFEVRLKPGAQLPQHVHPDSVMIGLADGKIRLTTREGQTVEPAVKRGVAVWSSPTAHTLENIGASEFHALHIEIKPPTTATQPSRGARPNDDSASPSHPQPSK